MVKLRLNFWVFLVIIISLSSCSKDKDALTIINPEDEGFYDKPFDKMPNLDEIVMYEANLRLFDSEKSLRVLTNDLDRIKDLGVNVLWLMPINKLGKEKAFGSPYCVQNYYQIEPEFGTLEDLRTLVKEAHNRDMAVILDWVANHTSWDNDWTKKNPSWYTKNSSGQMMPPAGTNWNDVVDLDYSNRDMRKAMIDAMKYWIEKANIDGYRCDAADWVPSDFWHDAIYELKNMEDGRNVLMLAEGTDKKNLLAGFDMDYAWTFGDALENLFANKATVRRLFDVHENEIKNLPNGKQKLRHNTNHDRAIENSPIKNFINQNGAIASYVLSTTMGGVPLIYSSQEVAYDKTVDFFKYVNIDWNQNQKFQEEMVAINKIYKENELFINGQFENYIDNDIVCYSFDSEDETILVMVNVRNENVDFEIPAELQNSSWSSLIDASNINLESIKSFNPFEYYILKK